MITLYTDETKNPRSAISAVAIRATYSDGTGSNSASYQARTADGKWHLFVKKYNPHLKIKIARPTPEQWRSTITDRGRTARYYISPEVTV